MSAPRRRPTPLEPAIAAVESAAAVDPPAKAVARWVRGLLGPGPAKDAISGTWVGHPVHPLLTDVVIGAWTMASTLDLIGGEESERASERLVALGVAAAVPTALTGASDWADAEPADDGVRRTGVFHALSNVTALTLYSASLVARRRGARNLGRLLGLAGAGVLGAGAYLGGHLSFAKGVGVDQTVFDPGTAEWYPVADRSQLPEGRPHRAVVDETPVMILRRGDELFALHDRCSHRGCSLSEGEVDGDEIVCACHGSRFALLDGSLRRGPATAPQPGFEVRLRGEIVEVRRESGAEPG